MGTLWRDSEGVRRGSNRGLRKARRRVGRLGGKKKEGKEAERVKRPNLESWREGFKGWRIEGEDKGRKRGGKGVAKEGEGLEGEDFPGKFRETPRPPDPTRTSFAQN